MDISEKYFSIDLPKDKLEILIKSLKQLALPSEQFYKDNFPSFKLKANSRDNNRGFRVNLQSLGKNIYYFRDNFEDNDTRHSIGINKINKEFMYLAGYREDFMYLDMIDFDKYLEPLQKSSREIEFKWKEHLEVETGQLFFPFYSLKCNGCKANG